MSEPEPINPFSEFAKVTEFLFDNSWEAYRLAGMPYGETDEGLISWFKEQIENGRSIKNHKARYQELTNKEGQ